MRIVAGFLRSPEGRAALQRAIDEARHRNAELLVVHSMRGGERDEVERSMIYRDEFDRLKQQLADAGIENRILEYARGQSPSEDLLQAAKDEGADLLVIGIRRRSPVGKLVLGSNAQNVLLNADCAVLSVKAQEE